MTERSRMLQALESFVLAGSWEASRAVVEAQPVLLSDDAIEYLQRLADEAERTGDRTAREVFDEHREQLERYRAGGIDAGDDPGLDVATILADVVRPAGEADMPRRIRLCRSALAQVDRERDRDAWATLQAALGVALMSTTIGDRADNVEHAIGALREALEALDPESSPRAWALSQNNLGQAYEARVGGRADANLEAALRAYEAALERLPPDADRADRGQIVNNLANAYAGRQRGLRDENRERAIAYYREALSLLSRDRQPVAWAQTQMNLGIALSERIPGDPKENLDAAIASTEEALSALDATAFPVLWASGQVNRGNALIRRAALGEGDGIDDAIDAYDRALAVFAEVSAPVERATALANLGTALLARKRDPRAPDVERAVECLDAALDVLSRELYPVRWALCQHNLANAYREREEGDPGENREKAIAAYLLASEVLTVETSPVEYAQIQKSLGSCYEQRTVGSSRANRLRAIGAYRRALAVREDVYGRDHVRVASVLYSLARVQRSAGDLQGARASLERALDIDEAAAPWSDKLARRYRRLAETAHELGDLPAAERALERALDLDERAYGPRHGEVVRDLVALARVREGAGDADGATSALERAVAIGELDPDADPVFAREALVELARLLSRNGAEAGARETLARAADVEKQLAPPERSPLTDGHGDTFASVRFARRHPRLAANIEALEQSLGAPAADVAETAAPAPPPASSPAAGQPVALRFREELKGSIDLEGGASLALVLHVRIGDLDRFLDPAGDARGHVDGVIRCAALGGEQRIVDGTYELQGSGRLQLRYRLPFSAPRGRRLLIARRPAGDGGEGAPDPSGTFEVELRDDDAGGPIARGTLRVHHVDLLRQLTTYRISAADAGDAGHALDRFGRLAFGRLWNPHARAVRAAARSDPPAGTIRLPPPPEP